MFSQLAKTMPRQVLESHFRDYVPEWLKYKRHLFSLGYCITDDPRADLHYRGCYDTWISMARSLGLENDIRQAERLKVGCFYARCPNPAGISGLGARFACDSCGAAAYCEKRCQVLCVKIKLKYIRLFYS
jgi:hypothetical protein